MKTLALIAALAVVAAPAFAENHADHATTEVEAHADHAVTVTETTVSGTMVSTTTEVHLAPAAK